MLRYHVFYQSVAYLIADLHLHQTLQSYSALPGHSQKCVVAQSPQMLVLRRLMQQLCEEGCHSAAMSLLDPRHSSTEVLLRTLKDVDYQSSEEREAAQMELLLIAFTHYMWDKDAGQQFQEQLIAWMGNDMSFLPAAAIEELAAMGFCTGVALSSTLPLESAHEVKQKVAVLTQHERKLVRQFTTLPLGTFIKAKFDEKVSIQQRQATGAADLSRKIAELSGPLHEAVMKSGSLDRLLAQATKLQKCSKLIVSSIPDDHQKEFSSVHTHEFNAMARAIDAIIVKIDELNVSVFCTVFVEVFRPIIAELQREKPDNTVMQQLQSSAARELKALKDKLVCSDKVRRIASEDQLRQWSYFVMRSSDFATFMQNACSMLYLGKVGNCTVTVDGVERLASCLATYGPTSGLSLEKTGESMAMLCTCTCPAENIGNLSIAKAWFAVWSSLVKLLRDAMGRYLQRSRSSVASKASMQTVVKVYAKVKGARPDAWKKAGEKMEAIKAGKATASGNAANSPIEVILRMFRPMKKDIQLISAAERTDLMEKINTVCSLTEAATGKRLEEFSDEDEHRMEEFPLEELKVAL